MSLPLLRPVARSGRHAVALPLASSSYAGPVCRQTRSYAVGKPKTAQKKKVSRGGPEEGSQQKNQKSVGTYLPMPVNQLKHPLFNVEGRTELVLPTFRAEILSQGDVAGKVMEFSKPEHGIIRAYGIPKNMLLEFRVLSKPCAVVRDVTLSTVEKLESAAGKSSKETRAVITGKRGSGKSYLLLQSVEYCASKDWIVLYIPRAINLVNSSTPYTYDARSRTYLQPIFSFEVLQRFLQVNATALRELKTTKAFEAGRRTLPEGSPLSDLVNIGIRDQVQAPYVLSTVLAEISKQTKWPVLLAIDDFQALYCQTQYRNEQFGGIKPYHLSLPRLLLEYASGKRHFARGAVLGAVSSSHTEFQPPLELREALGLSNDRPLDPYAKRSAELVGYAQGLQKLPMPEKLQISEAAALFEIWSKDNALHARQTDENFLTMYTEASGNPRDFVWKGMLSSFGI